MKRTLLGVFAVAALGIAGCATTAGGTLPPAAPSAAGADTPAATATGVVTVTEADNNSTVTLAAGQRLEVILHGSAQNPWAPIQADGPALKPATSGKMALQVGATGAAFTADQSGQVRITSSHKACASPTAGEAACTAIAYFVLTVTVKAG